MSEATTLPGMLEEQAARRPKGIAIRKKQLGVWRELTWSDYAQAVRDVALALDEAGVTAGDRIAILAENEPRWLYCDLGVQALGAVSVGVYPALEAEDVAVLLNAAGARTVFCGDQEHVDKLLDVRDAVSGLERIVVFDTKGLHTPDYEDAPLEIFDDFCARGRELHEQRSGRYAELLAARGPDDLIAFLTSGTTGAQPRTVLHSQRGQLAMARIVADALDFRPRDRSFALMSLPHATARLFDAYAPLVAGSSINFAESGETTLGDLAEIAPTVVVGTVRLLERMKGDVEIRMERAAWFKRSLYRWSMQRMTAAMDAQLAGKKSSPVGAWLGRALVGRFIVDKAGLSKLRYCGVGGSFVAQELIQWFWALGMPMRKQYGQVETGGIVSTQRGPEDAGTAGPPLSSDIQVRTDEDGELLVRGPGLLVGALDDAGTSVEDGWFRTGDLARIDDEGRIIPLGRRAEQLVTASGDEVAPAEIESTLKISPYVGSAMILAAGRPYVTALIELHQEAASEWARRQGIPVTTYGALVANDSVGELIAAQVEEANASLPEGRRVREFRLLPVPLDDELTPTGKIKRPVLEERYAALIDEMYAGRPLTPGAAG